MMKAEEEEESIPFDGAFSKEDREKLRQRRMALHLTQEKLADILEVKWETERNWENGKSTQCRLTHISLVKRFLNGELDEQIVERQEYERLKAWLRKCLKKNMLRNFEWALKIYRHRPEAGRRLLEELRQLVKQMFVQNFDDMAREDAGPEEGIE